MHLTAIFRRKEAFDLCIRRNIDFNHVDQHGNTPFHYACRAGSVEMMTALIAARAKKVANHLNQYPIHMAIESGKMECVNLLG
jgi:ankyrin repeat protein